MKKPGSTQRGRASFGWHMQTLTRIIRIGLQDRLAPLGLNISEFACCMALLEQEGVTQAELGRVTGTPEYTTSRTIEKLVQSGLVERLPHPTSRRAHQIYLTKKGKELAVQLPGIIKANNNRVLEGLEKAERAQLEDLLGKAIEHLTKTCA